MKLSKDEVNTLLRAVDLDIQQSKLHAWLFEDHAKNEGLPDDQRAKDAALGRMFREEAADSAALLRRLQVERDRL